MRLKLRRRFSKQRKTADLALAAYLAWRQECVAVRNAYLAREGAGGAGAALAFDAYEASLDREEVAVNVYAKLMGRVGHLVEIGLARQLTYVPSTAGASA